MSCGQLTGILEIDNIIIKKNSLLDKKDKEVSYDFSQFGSINEVQFIPKINLEQSTEICSRNSVTADKIGICS